MFEYIRDPAAIYRDSFATVRAEADLGGLPEDIAAMAVRLVHACGMIDIVPDLVYSPDVAQVARAAIEDGKPILVDARMVGQGVIRSRLHAGNPVICTLTEPSVPQRAEQLGTTQSAAAVELWGERLNGAVVAIGNAPTALFHLLELIAKGGPRPAAILGFPVGFIGAAESKEALIEHAGDIAFMTLRGRRGGSAIAAAAVNAVSGDPV